MNELSTLNKYFYKYRWRLMIGFLFVVASNYFSVLQPKVVRYALDMVYENIELYGLYDGFDLQSELYGDFGTTLLSFGGLMILLAVIMGIFMFFMRQTIIVMSRLIEYDLRNEIFTHYEKLNLSFYKRNNTGDLMARITEDVNKVRMYLGPAVMYSINLISLFALVIYSMLSVNVELTLWALAPLPVLSFSIYYVSRMINRKSTEIQTQLSVLNSSAQEVYSGIRVVKSYVQEAPMVKFFSKESDIYKEKSMDLAKIQAMFFPLMLILVGISTVLTIYIGGLKVAAGTITPGNIAEFIIYVNMLTWPVTALGWVASIIQSAAASQKRINEFLEIEPEIVENDAPFSKLAGAIEFNDVTFVYPDTGIKALENVNFKLEPGQKMAIIGKTGSGKTTIVDLLVRMYDATNGEISIDNKNIQSMSLSSLRQNIGYVPQDVFLFSDSISENVAFGNTDATQEEIERYTKYASVYDDIVDFSDGFETLVGERGVTLSGGQKQRISIARALIKQPDILILDDSLSAVDTTTEKRILNYLEKAMVDKTAIIITHRIYNLLDFDKIIVLEDGKVVETGTHSSLLKNKGFYYDLYEQQQMEAETVLNEN
ncbi:MAG: ATP-binding cassette subfamily B protein [Saprospiraceae bacterium]|jgi:ATP-binding cassette subfamily B protein